MVKSRSCAIIIAAICASLLCANTFAATAYVTTSGNDSTAVVDDIDKPFEHVSAAVAALGADGGTVSVAKGTYTESTVQDCVVVSAPIQIVGATGNPADVTVTKGSQYARIFKLDNASAKLKYITISGGNLGSSSLSSRTGAGVHITANGGVAEDCVISGNATGESWNSSGEGAGIYIANSSSARVTRCKIVNNTGGNDKSGGGIYAAGSALIESCLIAGQTRAFKYAVYLGGAGKLINCTIADNVNTKASGVYAVKTARVVNCAIFGNKATNDATGRLHVWDGTAASFINCAAEISISGTACVGGWAGFSAAGDHKLTPASCAVDAGTDPTSYGATSTTDLAGNPWYSGSNYDCGCYELDQSSLSSDFQYSLSAKVTSETNPAVGTFTAYALGATGTVSYQWDFGDGSQIVSTTENPIQHNYLAAGSYTVKLTATDDSGSVSVSRANCIVLAPFDLYVSLGNPNAVYPYDTTEKAAADIATAISAAMDGSVIHVLDGTYPITKRIEILKGITLKGEGESAEKAIIDTANKCQGLYIHHPDAKVQFLTVTRCKYSGSGGCVQIDTLGGAIEDCVLSYGDVSAAYNGCGGALYMAAGRVSRCVLRNSKDSGRTDFQSNGSGLAMSGGLAEDCLITENNCTADCTVYLSGTAKMVNCTIAGNNGTDHAGVCVASDTASVVNCAIFGNVASTDTTGLAGVICSKNNASNKPARFFYCAWDANVSGAVNCRYVTDPLFKDAAKGNYRISSSSELCDNGTDRSGYGCVSTTDLDGNARVVDDVDIGCYENQKDEMDVSLSIVGVQPLLPASVSLSGSVVGASSTVYYNWNFTNKTVGGSVEIRSSGTTSTYIWNPEAAGVYDIILKVTSGELSVETAPQTVQIGCKDLYVRPVNENAEFPYDTPAKAVTSIPSAIESAVDGSTIHILPGDDGTARYAISSQLSVTKAIALIGETSCRTNILIDGSSSNCRALYINNEQAIIRNLALKGNNNRSGRTVYLEGAGGSLSNCYIHATKGYVADWGSAGSLYGSKASVTHCEFVGDGRAHLENSRNGAIVQLTNSRIDNSIIRDSSCQMDKANETIDGGSVMRLVNSIAVNCTLVNTTCDKPGSVSVFADANSALTNCVIVGVSNTSAASAPVDIAGNVENCATDAESPISASSKIVTSSAFRNYAASDYMPAYGGALHNAGATIANPPATDLAGNARVVKKIDIGCYELPMMKGLQLILR